MSNLDTDMQPKKRGRPSKSKENIEILDISLPKSKRKNKTHKKQKLSGFTKSLENHGITETRSFNQLLDAIKDAASNIINVTNEISARLK